MCVLFLKRIGILPPLTLWSPLGPAALSRVLLTAALCVPLVLAGCDAAGPDSTTPVTPLPATAATAARTAGAVATDGLTPRSISAVPPGDDTAPTASATLAGSTAAPTASRGSGGLTYTTSYTRPPLSEDVKTVVVGDNTQNRDRRPCEPDEDPVLDDCDTSGGNAWNPPPPGPPGPVARIRYDSSVRPETYSNAEVVALSEALDSYGRQTPIDYMFVTANTTDNGTVLGSGSGGGPNLRVVALVGSVPRPRSGQINLCQSSSHRFKITGSAGTSDNTYWGSECRVWN